MGKPSQYLPVTSQPCVSAMSTSKTWDLNRHTTRCTSPVSLVSQCNCLQCYALHWTVYKTMCTFVHPASVDKIVTLFMVRSSPNLEHSFPVSYRIKDFLSSLFQSSILTCATNNRLSQLSCCLVMQCILFLQQLFWIILPVTEPVQPYQDVLTCRLETQSNRSYK